MLLLLLLAACTGPAGSPTAGRSGTETISASDSTSALAGSGAAAVPQPWTTAQPPEDCPTTRSTADVRPSPPINPDDLGDPSAPSVRHWYGNDALWVGLPSTGVLPAYPAPQGLLTKFPWWRALPGRLTIEAQRLDGPAGVFTADVPEGYGALGFQPTGLTWSVAGCWRLTGTVHNRSLTFIAWVQQQYP